MIEKVYFVDSDNVNPYHNQALLDYYFHNIPDDSMVFMLWQNNNSVLVGNDKSVYQQTVISQLEIEHAYLCRRKTLGRTVYNDLGVLNYAFIMYLNNYDIKIQINVIYQALRKLSIPVYLNNENEICLNNKLVTNNFYLTKNEQCLHTGSIYWDCDKIKRAKLLKEKISRNEIINITEENPLIYYSEVKKQILQSIADKYGKIFRIALEEDLMEQVESFRSYQYIYQPEKPYTIIVKEDCDFSSVVIYCDMIKRQILHMDIYLEKENLAIKQLIWQVFEKMIIDDVIFKKRIKDVDSKYQSSLLKIYMAIKKESYRI